MMMKPENIIRRAMPGTVVTSVAMPLILKGASLADIRKRCKNPKRRNTLDQRNGLEKNKVDPDHLSGDALLCILSRTVLIPSS
jgi:hypothetical protein